MKKPLQQPGFNFGWKSVGVKPDKIKGGFYGPRDWQDKAFKQLKDVQCSILNAPMGSGKSWEMCLLSAYKLQQDPSLRCIIAVPQTIIADGFKYAKLLMGKTKLSWCPRHDLCTDLPDDGTVNSVIQFLQTPSTLPNDRTLLCTHATIVAVYKRLKEQKKLKLFHNLVCWVDEAHHLKNAEVEGFEDAVVSNGIGEFVTYLVRYAKNAHVGLATASFFRGDRLSLLSPSLQEKFERFNLPYDEYLKTMQHLRSFSFDFLVCGADYTNALERLFKDRKKDIVYIPHPMSKHSTGDKYAEVQKILEHYNSRYKGEVVDQEDGLTVLQRPRSSFKIVDLVDEDRRKAKKEYFGKIENPEDLDAIIALGMFKEGANWIWADRSIIVGTRASLVDVIQMIGRLFRDATGKEHVQVIQLLPFSLDQSDESKFQEDLNSYLKAIYASLILENILNPVQLKDPKGKKKKKDGFVPKTDLLGELLPDDAKQLSLIEDVSNELLGIIATNNEAEETTELWNEYQKVLPSILEDYGISAEHVEPVGKQIWSMFARRAIQLQGANVDNIDFDIVKTNPLGCLLRYTSGAWGIKTFEKLRIAIEKYRDPISKKNKLLKMADSGEPRPTLDHPLGHGLTSYIRPSHSCYDAVFTTKIRDMRPDWFRLVNNKKKDLLQIAKDGEERPDPGKHPLGRVLKFYTNQNNAVYDAEFDKAIRELAPSWFETPSVVRKKNVQKLIELARTKQPRPSSGCLSLLLVRLTNPNTGRSSYDSELDKQIRELAPSWFENSATENKKKLLEMAKKGEPRPTKSKHPLASVLRCYLGQNGKHASYDIQFAKQIRELAPHWFVNSLEERQKELLEMARNKEPRPNKKTKLGGSLSQYTLTDSRCPEFDKQIRELAPHWFVTRTNIANEKKEKLLEMAERGEPRPTKKHPLGSPLISYTRQSSRDPEFDKQIRELAPHWFVTRTDIANEKKEKLLEMAKSGEERPASKKHPLGTTLINYTCSASSDPKFAKEIKETAPQWFKNET